MRPYSQTAAAYRLSLMAGVATPEEIVAWADAQLAAAPEYDDDLANISLAEGKSAKDMQILLENLVDDADGWAAFRVTLGRIHHALSADSTRGLEFWQFIFKQFFELITPQDTLGPKDMHFFFRLDEEFELALEGIQGTIETATSSLLHELKKNSG